MKSIYFGINLIRKGMLWPEGNTLAMSDIGLTAKSLHFFLQISCAKMALNWKGFADPTVTI